jgi:uncharacterized membrane protein
MKKYTKIVATSLLIISALVINVTAKTFNNAGWGNPDSPFVFDPMNLMNQQNAKGEISAFMVYRLGKALNLSEAQRSDLKAIQKYIQEKRTILSSENHKASMITLLEQPILDQQQALLHIEMRLQNTDNNIPELIGKIATFTNSLTQEQRDKLGQVIQQRKQHNGNRPSRGGNPWLTASRSESAGELMVKRLTQRLNLTKSQVDNVKTTLAQMQQHHGSHLSDEQMANIIALLQTPELDQQQLLALNNNRRQEIRVNASQMVSTLATFTDSLTPEQRSTLIQTIQNRGKH